MSERGIVRTVVLRVAALAILLLLVLVSAISIRTLGRLPNTVIYFVQSDDTSFSLQPAYRRSRARGGEAFVRAAVRGLVDGPDAAERNRGLTSEVPGDVEILDVRLDGERLYLDLSAAFERGGGSSSQQARLTQLYYTVTQPTDISEVVLSLDGLEVSLFGADGLLLEQPWRRSDHSDAPRW